MTTVIISFLVLIIYFLGTAYQTSISQAQQVSLMRLGGIVNTLAIQIDGNQHQQLTMQYLKKDDIQSSLQDSNYLKIHKLLQQNYVASMLNTPIYTIVFDSLSNVYQFGVTSSEKPYYRHAYTSAPKELMEKHAQGAMIPMYKDEFGMWLSAFATIKNKKGEVVALVQADEKFDDFIAAARQKMLVNLGISLGVFLALLFVLLRILRSILRQEMRDKEALFAANTQIKQLDDFRKEMIANVSHDLRTPMSSILGYSEILQHKKAQLTENEVNKYINVIHTEGKRMNAMITDLFDLSKLEAGQIILEKDTFNFSELAQDILYHYQLKAEAKQVRLITNFEEPLPLIEADIRWMDRVVQNLLENALKYVNPQGFVKFTIFVEDNDLHFKVCNSGTPLKQEHLGRVFDRYFKSENQDSQSTGLGLAIVKKVIDLHGGTIWAESDETITTFRFKLKIRT